jgi:NADH:ubiquinone reductase (H+-translocating)
MVYFSDMGVTIKQQTVPKVVVVGGGFAGIATVKALLRSGVRCDITLISKSETFEYYPALYKLVTGALAIEVAVPLRRIFPGNRIKIVQGTFVGTDPARQVVTLEGGIEHPYDYLVLALGSQTNYFGIKGLPELSLSFKSVKEAFRLKRHFCNLFNDSIGLPNKEVVAKLHTVIVGGGPSGVELAGDLTHYLRELAKELSVDPSLVTVDLIEAGNRVLPTLSEKVSALAERRLRTLGVNIYLNRAVMSQDIFGVSMGNMDFQSSTVIWTAGTQINESYKTIPTAMFTDRKRIVVNEYLALPADNHIFVAGDGAGTQYSGLAQTAIRDGSYLGKHLATVIRGGTPQPYKPKPVSFVIPIGNYWALFVVGKKIFKGFVPWILRSAVDFRYFCSIVPLWYVLDVFRQGRVYRRSKTYCPSE